MTEELNPMTAEEGAEQWKAICMEWCRSERDNALAKTDYIHLPDVSVSEEYKAQVLEYRQALRDFPAQWSTLYDGMTEEQQNGVTELSIREVMPVAP